MICRELQEGDQFWCAGNLYTMLIPRDETQCFEAVLESVEPGGATPPNAHATFVQMYALLRGKARLHIGDEKREAAAPAVAYIPLNTPHHVENRGEETLQYIYVSIWPGQIPMEDGHHWRQSIEQMIEQYESRGHAAKPRQS